jgi:hypothetical protein
MIQAESKQSLIMRHAPSILPRMRFTAEAQPSLRERVGKSEKK